MSQIQTDKLVFEKLDFAGVETLVFWAQQEGWNPGPHDAEVFFATDPDGFYSYFYDGELIAGGSVISYNGEFGFMGFFIVKPELRGEGIGRKLWFLRRAKLLERLNKGAVIGMDGVVDMQPFYSKGGFKLHFRDERYVVTGASFLVDRNVTPITPQDYPVVFAYDKQCFGFAREAFLKRWLEIPGTFCFKYMQEEQLFGFAVVRKAAEGYKIGPLLLKILKLQIRFTKLVWMLFPESNFFSTFL